MYKRQAKKAGVGVPSFAEVSDYDEAVTAIKNMKYPVMVKPTNSSGSCLLYTSKVSGISGDVDMNIGYMKY